MRKKKSNVYNVPDSDIKTRSAQIGKTSRVARKVVKSAVGCTSIIKLG